MLPSMVASSVAPALVARRRVSTVNAAATPPELPAMGANGTMPEARFAGLLSSEGNHGSGCRRAPPTRISDNAPARPLVVRTGARLRQPFGLLRLAHHLHLHGLRAHRALRGRGHAPPHAHLRAHLAHRHQRQLGGRLVPLARRSSCSSGRCPSAPPATTTVAPTTAPTSSARPPAPWATWLRATRASPASRSSCRTCTAT